MGLNPNVDERMMLLAMNAETSALNAERILGGAFLGVIDCYDRRIERINYVTIVNRTTWLYDVLGRIQTLQLVIMMLEDGKLTADVLKGHIKELTDKAEETRKELLKERNSVSAR